MKTVAVSLLSLCLLAACASSSPLADTAPAPAASSASASTTTPDTSAESTAHHRSLRPQPLARRWWHDAVVYEIWPRSFKDADGDGHGDFRGMIQGLPHLQSLGVDAIWLTPVFEAPSYHGYDFEDFYAIERDYGTMADFEAFVAASHARDIKVVLDLVINHISDRHDWFLKSARREPGYEDFFIWRDERPAGWGQAWSNTPNPAAVWHWNATRRQYYYGAFGGSQPDVNLRNPKVVEEMNRLASFWLEKGVDGFRLDAVRYAIEDGPIPGQADTQATFDYWNQFAAHVRSVKPDAMLVGEAWADLGTVGRYRDGGKGLDSAFDFEFGELVIGILNPDTPRSADFGTLSADAPLKGRDDLWNNLRKRHAAAPMGYFSPFLTNHDQTRIGHVLKGDMAKGKIAASLLATTPGTLYLYYGEEIGLGQFKTGDDRYRRAVMPWTEARNAGFNATGRNWLDAPTYPPNPDGDRPWWGAYWQAQIGQGRSVQAQDAAPDSLLNHYRKMLAIRAANPRLAMPEEIRYFPVDDPRVWAVQSIGGGGATWVLVNLDSTAQAEFATPEALRGERLDQVSGARIAIGPRLTLAPGQTRVF